MITIGIDITSIIYGRGVSQYTANLVRVLEQRHDIKLELYGSSFRQKRMLEKFAAQHPHSYTVIQSYPPSIQNILWNSLHLNPLQKILPSIHAFHSWDWLQPPDEHLPLISTIHDLAILKFPDTAHPKILAMHQKSWQILKERGAEIIAVSQSTRKDIVEHLHFPPEKVHVIYEALPQETIDVAEHLDEEEYETIKEKLQLTRPYLFFVGTREPRKNLARLVEAWRPLAKDLDLIIAGDEGWDEFDETVEGLRFFGRVTAKELAVLYGECEVFVYPSLYEGFGLPILEAFYHGVPVVTSNISSMPEVAGNAAELVDPQSVEGIRGGIMKILQESKEDQQKRLQRMIIRLQLFHWERVGEETVRVYQRAISNSSGN